MAHRRTAYMTDSEVTVYFDFPRDCLEPESNDGEFTTIEFNRGPMCWKVTGCSAVRYTPRKWRNMIKLDRPQVMRFCGIGETELTLAIYRESSFIIFGIGTLDGVGTRWGAPVATCRAAFEAIAAGMADYMRQIAAKRAAKGDAMPTDTL